MRGSEVSAKVDLTMALVRYYGSEAPMKEKMFRFLSTLVAKFILGKDDLEDLVFSKYHSLNAYWAMTLNYLTWRLGLKKSFRIVSLVIEPTNQCTLHCLFCPTKDDMTRQKGFMDFDLYKKIIDENSRVEFVNLFLWGEPLLHPRIFEMVKYAKDKGIEVHFYSNATLLNEKTGRAILESGADRVVFSLDGIGEMYEKIRNFPYPKIEQNILDLLALRKELKARTAIDVSMVVGRETECAVKEFKEKWTPIVDTVRLQRQNTYEKNQRSKSCFELWRGNVLIHWDGTVAICFIDYDATVKLGDANKHSIKDIYNGAKYQQMRSMQTQGKFPRICQYCSEYETKEVSSRVAS